MPTAPPNPSEILTQPCDGFPSFSGQLNKATKCFPTGPARLLLECTGVPSLECLPRVSCLASPLHWGGGWPARVIPPLEYLPKARAAGWLDNTAVVVGSDQVSAPAQPRGAPQPSLDPTSALGACELSGNVRPARPSRTPPPTSSNTDPAAQPTPFGSCHPGSFFPRPFL